MKERCGSIYEEDKKTLVLKLKLVEPRNQSIHLNREKNEAQGPIQ